MNVHVGAPSPRVRRGLRAIGPFPLVVSVFGVLALLAPFGAAEQPLRRVGALLAVGGALQILHGVRRADDAALKRAVTGGVFSTLMGLLVLVAPDTASAALVLFLAITFAMDGIGYLFSGRRGTGQARTVSWLGAAGDLATAAALLFLWRTADTWMVAIAAALRLFGIAWAMATTPVHTTEDAAKTVIDDLGLGDHPEAVTLAEQITLEERVRSSSDRRWTIAFLVTLFAIHSTRLQSDGTLLGYAAPAIAVVGDAALALLFAFLIATPMAVSLRSSTRWIERTVWRWYLSVDAKDGGLRRRAAGAWLRYRLRAAVQLREARFSVPAAMWRCLAIGVPIAAIVAATVPVWGMSWFFDTENWASGIWNSWAEARTDTWREAMVRAVPGGAGPATFAVTAPGIESGDFSFVVIGDTGEGDASQQVLRDQIQTVMDRDEVKFLAISSDVVYPNGSMIDYENRFWLQFKGVTKPVFAIPGNHDWYDALEAFLATFLQHDAARAAMRARAEADLKLTSTSESRIDHLIAEAARLRGEYNVPTGFQRGPFFEIQTDRFALVAVDTGIVKRIDPAQRAWLESALDRARGKLIMAVLGHPLYAKSFDMAANNPDFARLKQLLVDRGVAIVMAGDTHDLEYYAEPTAGGRPAVQYFVNGGGGAYLSLGTGLDWPDRPLTPEWAYYPPRDAIAAKIQRETPWWKRPAWWWTTRYHAWPFSSEYLSALFDYNVAPFFQSFFEIRVERSANRVRLWPYGVHGRLRWRDLSRSAAIGIATGGPDDFAEWVVPMR
jgi:uncharacterized membrane protein HdeD (DUF308 family)/3',5'-cyclic AMP phosphodiesterase CpdA